MFSFPFLSSFFRPFLRFIYFLLFFPFSLLLGFLWMFFYFFIFDFPDLALSFAYEGWVCDKILKDGAWNSSELCSSFNLLNFRGVLLPLFDIVQFFKCKRWRFECRKGRFECKIVELEKTTVKIESFLSVQKRWFGKKLIVRRAKEMILWGFGEEQNFGAVWHFKIKL